MQSPVTGRPRGPQRQMTECAQLARASCHPWLLPTEEVSINLGGRQATFKLFINLTLMKHEEEAVVLSFRLHGLPIQPMAAQGLSQNWEPSGTFHVETTMLQFA